MFFVCSFLVVVVLAWKLHAAFAYLDFTENVHNIIRQVSKGSHKLLRCQNRHAPISSPRSSHQLFLVDLHSAFSIPGSSGHGQGKYLEVIWGGGAHNVALCRVIAGQFKILFIADE